MGLDLRQLGLVAGFEYSEMSRTSSGGKIMYKK